jgi:hypothetical protein
MDMCAIKVFNQSINQKSMNQCHHLYMTHLSVVAMWVSSSMLVLFHQGLLGLGVRLITALVRRVLRHNDAAQANILLKRYNTNRCKLQVPTGKNRRSNIPTGPKRRSNIPTGTKRRSNIPTGTNRRSNIPSADGHTVNKLAGGRYLFYQVKVITQ